MTQSDNIRAAALITFSMAAFTINDAMMKLAAPDLPFFQQILMRGTLIIVGLYIWARLAGHMQHVMSRNDRKLSLIRMTAEAVGTLLFLKALFTLPLANLSAILQGLPLTVTLAAALFLGETVGWKRIAAILVGFIGVAIIIRPGVDGFSIYSIYGVGTVIAVTIRDLAARRLSKGIPSSRVALGSAVGVTLLAAGGSVVTQESWVVPNLGETMLLAGAAGCLMIGYVTAVAGMRSGDLGFVAPFRYSSLLVALILGHVLFDEWPDAITMLGAAIVVGTGLFTIYRERVNSSPSTALPSKGARLR